MLKIHYVNNVDTNEWRKTWSIKSSISLRNAIGIHSWPYHSIRPIPLTNNRNRVKNILSIYAIDEKSQIDHDEYLIVSWLSTRTRKSSSRKIAPTRRIVEKIKEKLTCYVSRDRTTHCQKLRGILYLFYTFIKRFIEWFDKTLLKFFF